MNATIGIVLIVLVVLLTVATYLVSTPATKQEETKRKTAVKKAAVRSFKKDGTVKNADGTTSKLDLVGGKPTFVKTDNPAQPKAEERVSIIDQVLAETMKVQETKAAEPAPTTEEKKAE
jgi:flagellar basal body-associated protein FliL